MQTTTTLPLVLLAFTGSLCAQSFQPATQTFHSDSLKLDLRYLAALNREEPARLATLDSAVFSLHPEKASVDACAPVVLALGSGIPDEGAKHKEKHAGPPTWGTLSLSEVDRKCLDQSGDDSAQLARLVGRTEKLEGMHSISPLTNYTIQGNTVWWAASTGFGRNAKGKRVAKAGTALVGTMGAVVNGHLLLWTVTSNDVAVFNRMLDLSVCLDSPACSEGYSRLTHFQAGSQPTLEMASQTSPAAIEVSTR